MHFLSNPLIRVNVQHITLAVSYVYNYKLSYKVKAVGVSVIKSTP